MFGKREATPIPVLGLDLGTSRVRAVARDGRVVVDEPALVAWEEGPTGRRLVGVGDEALRAAGRPGVRTVQPVRGGAFEDWAGVEALARYAMERAAPSATPRAVVVAVPGDASETERRALDASLRSAGAQAVHRVDTMLAAGLGSGAWARSPEGSMIVATGAGRTEAAILARHGVAVRRAARIGGDAMDAALVHWLRREHHVLVPPAVAERVKLDVGAARVLPGVLQTRLRARDLGTGQPVTLDIASPHTVEALREVVERVVQTVLDTLRDASPELSADVLERGLLLVGGAARLRDLDAVLRQATGLPCLLVDEPERVVVTGLGRLLADPTLLRELEDEPT